MSTLPLHIDAHSVKDLMDGGDDFLLLDCRGEDEYKLVRIEGSRHLPMAEVPARSGELAAYREKRIVVHCHHGIRSLQVTQWLREQGFEGAQNLMGGIDVWSLLIDTALPRY